VAWFRVSEIMPRPWRGPGGPPPNLAVGRSFLGRVPELVAVSLRSQYSKRSALDEFPKRQGNRLVGVLSGFDRLLLQGTLHYNHPTTSFPRRCSQLSPLSRGSRALVACRLPGTLTCASYACLWERTPVLGTGALACGRGLLSSIPT